MGNGKSGASKKFTSSVFSFENLSEEQQLEKISQLQMMMGQTGMEAGNPKASPNNKLYVNTGKSMNINAYLLSGGKDIYSSESNWNGLVDKTWIKNAITKIDAGMKPMAESVQTVRFLSGDALGKMFGLNVNSSNIGQFINNLQSNTTAGKEFTNLMKSTDYVHKGYTSTTYIQNHSSYDNRDVRLNITVKKGTDAIVTNNHAEHEILVGKNTKYDFSKGKWKVVTTKTGKKQLVIDVAM